jgi:hypothetical protein
MTPRTRPHDFTEDELIREQFARLANTVTETTDVDYAFDRTLHALEASATEEPVASAPAAASAFAEASDLGSATHGRRKVIAATALFVAAAAIALIVGVVNTNTTASKTTVPAHEGEAVTTTPPTTSPGLTLTPSPSKAVTLPLRADVPISEKVTNPDYTSEPVDPVVLDQATGALSKFQPVSATEVSYPASRLPTVSRSPRGPGSPASGSGCEAGETLPDGQWAGFVAAATTTTLLFDLVCWYSGIDEIYTEGVWSGGFTEESIGCTAYGDDFEPCVGNQSAVKRTVTLARSVEYSVPSIIVMNPTVPATANGSTASEFRVDHVVTTADSFRAWLSGGTRLPMWVEIVDGKVTRVQAHLDGFPHLSTTVTGSGRLAMEDPTPPSDFDPNRYTTPDRSSAPTVIVDGEPQVVTSAYQGPNCSCITIATARAGVTLTDVDPSGAHPMLEIEVAGAAYNGVRQETIGAGLPQAGTLHLDASAKGPALTVTWNRGSIPTIFGD